MSEKFSTYQQALTAASAGASGDSYWVDQAATPKKITVDLILATPAYTTVASAAGATGQPGSPLVVKAGAAATGSAAAGGKLTVIAGAGDGVGYQGNLYLTGGPGAATSGGGGYVYITGGDNTKRSSFNTITSAQISVFSGEASGVGGGIHVAGGDAATGSTSKGGDIYLIGGAPDGNGIGGGVYLFAGPRAAHRGTGSQAAGVYIVGGYAGVGSNHPGGDIQLTPGSGDGTGRHGVINLFGLQTTDPSVAGAVFSNNGGIVALSGFLGHGTATATAGAATLNAQAGKITSEALTGATTYTLTLTNSYVKSTSQVLVTATNSANLLQTVDTVTEGSGSVVIVLSMAALTGTVIVRFAVFN